MPSPSPSASFLDLISPDFAVLRGHPIPFGASPSWRGVNFSVYARHATAVSLVLFAPGEETPAAEFPLDPRYNRTGDVWHAFLRGLDPSVTWAWRAERSIEPGAPWHRYGRTLLLDPYARAVAGAEEWGADPTPGEQTPWDRVRARRGVVHAKEFDWGFDQPIDRHLADSVIYELHVRSFTRHPSSGVGNPGTFRGVVEKIPYLVDLGVTAVELMPVTEFEENDSDRRDPATGERLRNLWGYHPVSFFAPRSAYAAGRAPGAAVDEFREMVKALHEAGIEVILDMVFNHTGEGDEKGPTHSFRGLDNSTYYILDGDGRYTNFSGCGNTFNCNHPVVRNVVLDALRYWVTEMHVDGFRFDLASILGRGRDGSVLANPPLLEQIAADPVLANAKLIAEAWDAAGLYQVGHFPNWGRWAEWNGRYRDDVRRFVKGDPGMVSALATRLSGSADLYQGGGRAPYHSINFVTSHDGFPLADLFTYSRKYNEANGEGNRDGGDDNNSWNCGFEGPGAPPEVGRLRRRMARNALALLLVSQGVPMLLAGDEAGRTQRGNNNAYCQDNEISWFDWDLVGKNADLFRFVRTLVRFRKGSPLLRRRSFVAEGPGSAPVTWHGHTPYRPDWSPGAVCLGMHLKDPGKGDDVYVVANAGHEAHRVELVAPSEGRRWHVVADTYREPPADVHEEGTEPLVVDPARFEVGPRSVVVLVGKKG
jgi:glycogen operon protein